MSNFVKASYNEKTKTVEFVADNGDRLLRSGGTIAWRFNNPGNLRPGSKYNLHIGQGQTASGPFLIFPTPEAGRKEKKGLLLRKYGDHTISTMLYAYAPPKENDTEGYIEHVCKKTGFSRDQEIRQLSDDGLTKLMTAMEEREGYNHKKETRKEIWVHATSIAFSNGAAPLSDLPIKIVRNGVETIVRTNTFGLLAPLVHYHIGEVVEIWAEDIKNTWKKIDSLVLGDKSQVLTYVRDLLVVKANAAQHNPILGKSSIPTPIKYVVQPSDTLYKIAKRFKVDADKVQSDNAIRNPNLIMPGQVLMIRKGPASSTATSTSAAIPAPTQQRNASTGSIRSVTTERSKEGKGHPIAIIPVDQKRAPWMAFALGEAKQWAGKTEAVIGKTRNYHRETGQTWFKSMEGDTNAWCASFVNYCLMLARYPMSQNKARAKSFSNDPNFLKIDKPIYGAIAVYGRKGGGHVAFVYGKQKKSDKLIVLGGNQGDMITFVARSSTSSLVGYYVPAAYKAFADNDMSTPLDELDVDEINKSFGIKADKSGREA